ncbi:hypothetical protein QTG54_001353 [Skeletonema marinoi]|uniref:SET domain-containing protein n=1 Tax=Skeletonema marinoi TaxID=267567 RepID=A0AAD9DIY5_9STRA|nr:hypothetical protein QTG54_001353 [Skeletonema marinoi]
MMRSAFTTSLALFAMKLLLTIFPFLCTITAAVAAPTSSPLPTDERGDYNAADIIEWIRSKPDGIIHESLRVGRETPGDPNSINGLFVKSDAKAIEKGDVIAHIPWDCTINPGKKYRFNKFESCANIYKLAEELRLGEDSTKAPYVRYLLNLPRGTMPGEWNQAAKEFLSVVLGHDQLPPYEDHWKFDFTFDWVGECEGHEDDEFERAAYHLNHSRDEDTLMVPIYDMMNHSNDPKKLNTFSYKPKETGDVFRVVASKRIEPGEQVYNSYNRCNRCSMDLFGIDRDDCETFSNYRTPDILSYFGFIEDYPQSWIFDSNDSSDDDAPSEFDICMLKNSETGEIDVYWGADKADDHDIEWAEAQLKRLRKLLKRKEKKEKELVGEGDDKIGRYQWDTIWRYHGALVTALEAAVEKSFFDSSDDDDSSDDSSDDKRNEKDEL